MRQPVSIAVELRWPAPSVAEVIAGDAGVLLGQRRRALPDRQSDFPLELRVPFGHHGIVGHDATMHVGSEPTSADQARLVTITPTARRHLLPSLEGTLSAVVHGSGSQLVLTGTAQVPFGGVLHGRGGQRRLERSLRHLLEEMAANVERVLEDQRRAEARRALLPFGLPERHGRWAGTNGPTAER